MYRVRVVAAARVVVVHIVLCTTIQARPPCAPVYIRFDRTVMTMCNGVILTETIVRFLPLCCVPLLFVACVFWWDDTNKFKLIG